MGTEVLAILGFTITAGTLIGKVSATQSAKIATLEQRMLSLEQVYKTSLDLTTKHLDRQDEKLDKLISHHFEMMNKINKGN